MIASLYLTMVTAPSIMKHYLPTWLSLTCITWLIAALFIMLSIRQLWVYTQYGSKLIPNHAASVSKPDTGNPISRQRIITSSYFGQYLPDDGQGIQQADLDFVLAGVLYSDNTKDSQVIVRQSNQDENFYHVNDALPGGALVKKITENSVIVLLDGKLQQLSLPKQLFTFDAEPKE